MKKLNTGQTELVEAIKRLWYPNGIKHPQQVEPEWLLKTLEERLNQPDYKEIAGKLAEALERIAASDIESAEVDGKPIGNAWEIMLAKQALASYNALVASGGGE